MRKSYFIIWISSPSCISMMALSVTQQDHHGIMAQFLTVTEEFNCIIMDLGHLPNVTQKQEGNSLSDRPQIIIISQVFWVASNYCSKCPPILAGGTFVLMSSKFPTTTARIKQMSSKPLPPQLSKCPPNHYRHKQAIVFQTTTARSPQVGKCPPNHYRHYCQLRP